MADDTLLLMLLLGGAVLALAFGIWVGLGSPGLYDRHEATGQAPRNTPWLWLLAGRQKTRSSRFDAMLEAEEAEPGEDADEGRGPETEPPKPDFSRGRRFRR